MSYEWDEEKNKKNFKKHGVYFEEAITIFEDDTLQISQDDGAYGEERFWAIGRSKKHRTLIVIFCERKREGEEIVRIISARRLDRYEKKRLGWL